jgi:rubredoxin
MVVSGERSAEDADANTGKDGSHMKNRKCLNCEYEFEENTNLEDDKLKPKTGDISFCIKCGQVSRFGEDGMIPVKLDDLDRENLIEILKIRKLWKGAKR